MPNALQAVSIGAVILFAVVAMPVVIGSTTGETSQTLQLEEGETRGLSDRLEITNEQIRPPTPENATFTVSDNETVESETQTIQNGSNATYAFSGGNVTLSVVSVTDSNPETTTVVANTSTTYGWSPAEKTVASNLGLIMVAVVFIIILGLVGSVVGS